jgi:Zn-dependent protease with chaperone function
VLIALAWVVLRSLWVRFTPPEGFELTRAESPRLFDLIDELTVALNAPRIHHVLVLNFFNAAIDQIPRFGFFGGHRNYLLLGLPLMQSTSPAQFRAILAHELGHLSGNHGRFSGWIYRLRETWGQLLTRLEREERWGSFFFTTFFNWYAPYFQAYSFVLARTHEYEADEAAARLTGAENAAEALIDVRLKGSFLEENYWPEVYRHAATEPRPVAGVYANLPQTLSQPLPHELVASQLNLALAEQTISEDTHPALADRLRALGYPPARQDGDNNDWTASYQPATVTESAADFYLARQAQALISHFDHAWQQDIAEQWSERYNDVRRAQQTLDALEEKARAGTLSFDEAWTRASLASELRPPAEAIDALREVLRQQADHAAANFLLGQLLLREQDTAGIAHLEQASARNPDMLIPACHVLYAHFTAAGQPAEAERYRERANNYFEKLEEAQPERSSISAADELLPHQATPETVENLRGQLSPFPQIKTAYLAQKRLEKMPEKPLYVLGIVANAPWYQLDRTALNRQLINEVVSQVAFTGETLVVVLDGEHKKLLKQFHNLEGAQVFP